MTVLLDTHTFLWFIAGSPKLSVTARSVIETLGGKNLISLVSLWEIAIKQSSGKLTLSTPFGSLLDQQIRSNGFEILGIQMSHIEEVAMLPFHHRDPFDRLLIAQAMTESLPIVGVDAAFDAYPIQRLW